jgi:hypothetical protein
MRTDLATVLTKIADRLAADVDELRSALQEMAAREEPPPAPRAPRKAKAPVPESVRLERESRYDWYVRLSVALGHNPSIQFFADRNSVSRSEVSRFFTRKARSVSAESITGQSIARALECEIARMEKTLSTRYGNALISTLRTMALDDNTSHERNPRRTSANRTGMSGAIQKQIRRVTAARSST